MIYGVGNKKLGETNLSNQECPNCNETNTVFIHGIVKIFSKRNRFIEFAWRNRYI
jgi:hypothetical protein